MLVWIKVLHTVVWVFFVACILGVYIFAHVDRFGVAWVLIGIVLVEVIVLACNGMACPLTGVAGQYTEERVDNFDIYLPEWLAKHNKTIFGTLYVFGILYTLYRWMT